MSRLWNDVYFKVLDLFHGDDKAAQDWLDHISLENSSWDYIYKKIAELSSKS